MDSTISGFGRAAWLATSLLLSHLWLHAPTHAAQSSVSPIPQGWLATAFAAPAAPSHFRASSSLSLRAQHCVGRAAVFHQVNADVLHAIMLVESDGRPGVINRNSNGTMDIGMAQINSIHLPELSRHGIQAEHLFDECVAAFVAAWHYARQVRRLGNTWQAIGAYHSRTPHHNQRYQRLVFDRLVRLGVLADARLAAGSTRTHTGSVATGSGRAPIARAATSATARAPASTRAAAALAESFVALESPRTR